jgi:hypothetical protein
VLSEIIFLVRMITEYEQMDESCVSVTTLVVESAVRSVVLGYSTCSTYLSFVLYTQN